MNNKSPLLGILGGLGPMASVYFYEMLTSHTDAKCDQEHIDIILSSRATTPDRTAFITGKSSESPLPIMLEEVKRLEKAGAEILCMPCNTAHYFIDELKSNTRLPMIDIIDETLKNCISRGYKKIGLLATEGTVSTGSYEHRAKDLGVEILTPDEKMQGVINDIIYKEIKEGKPADKNAFFTVAEYFIENGCETIVLGCTELSLVKKQEQLGPYYTDSLEALAYAVIKACGKKPFGFDFENALK